MMAAKLRAHPADGDLGRPLLSVALALSLGFALSLLAVYWLPVALAATLAIVGVAWLTRYPQWLLVVFTISLGIPVQKTIAGLPINASDLLVVLWGLLWLFIQARPAAPRLLHWRLPTVVWAILPFLAVALVANALSINTATSTKQVLRLVEWFAALPLLLMVFVPGRRFWRFVSVLLLLAPCLFAIDGLVEVANSGRSLSGMLGIPVPLPPGDAHQLRHTFDVSGRAGSTFGGAQGLAMYLVVSMSVIIAHVFRPPEPWLRPLALASLLVCIAGLIVAESRGGLLGALAVFAAIGMAAFPALQRWLPVGLGLMVAAAVAVLVFWPGWDGSLVGLVPGRPAAVLDRLIIWGIVREVALSSPFFGVGLGNFREVFFEYNPWLNVPLGYFSLHAHNTYFEVLSGTGMLGLLAYLGFLFAIGWRLLVNWREGLGAAPSFTLAAIGTLTAYMVFATVDMLLLENMHMLLVLLLTLGLTQRGAPAIGLANARAGTPG